MKKILVFIVLVVLRTWIYSDDLDDDCYEKRLWENAYNIIDTAYNDIHPDSKLYYESIEFVDKALRSILYNYSYDDRVYKLFERFKWLGKIESSDKRIIGYTYGIWTSGTGNEAHAIISYKENNYCEVHSIEELFPRLDGELIRIEKVENNVYLLYIIMRTGGYNVRGGYLCVEIVYENYIVKIIPKNVFDGMPYLAYFIPIDYFHDFSFNEHNKTINIRMRNDNIQMKYENGIFAGDYAKYEDILR
jgi:hypothetical protein